MDAKLSGEKLLRNGKDAGAKVVPTGPVPPIGEWLSTDSHSYVINYNLSFMPR